MSEEIASKAESAASEPRKKIRLPPYRGLRPPPIDRRKRQTSWMQLAMLVGGFVVAAALILDIAQVALARNAVASQRTPTTLMMDISRSTNRYVDRERRFTIAVPPGWTVQQKSGDEDYELTLSGPGKMQLCLLATYAPGKSLADLKKEFAETEADQRIITHIQDVVFKGRPAIQRFCRLKFSSYYALDLVAHGTAFHLMGTIPTDDFASHQPVISALIETFEPLPPPP